MRDAEALITQLKAHYQIAPDIDVTWSSRRRASDLGGRYGIHPSGDADGADAPHDS